MGDVSVNGKLTVHFANIGSVALFRWLLLLNLSIHED